MKKQPATPKRPAGRSRSKGARTSDDDDALRWEHYRAIPHRHWLKMAGGLHPEIVKQHAKTYGFPFGSSPVDLSLVVRRLHEFLTENADVLQRSKRGDDHARLKCAQADYEEIKVAQKREVLVSARKVSKDRMGFLAWMIGRFDAAAADLPSLLAGKTPADQRRVIAEYFEGVRREAADSGA